MEIEDSRKCNRMNLKKVESFLGIKNNYLEKIYEELICDEDFIDAINQIQITNIELLNPSLWTQK